MLELKFVQKNQELIEKSLIERGMNNYSFSYLFSLDNKRKVLLNKLDGLRKKKRIMTQSIEDIAIANKKPGYKAIEKIKRLNITIKNHEKKMFLYEKKINEILIGLPNVPHLSVPEGVPGGQNKTVCKGGKKRKFNFHPRTYLEIGKKLGILDFAENCSKLSFDAIFYKGLGARLQRALINFLMDFHTGKKYSELLPPSMTEGWPILKLLEGKVFREEELPEKYCTYSLCFRKDWNFSQDVRGSLKRVKQFDSVESIQIVKQEYSNAILENIINEGKEIMKLLELPYEVFIFTRGNLDYVATKAYSIKVFLPGLGTFLEIAICSNQGDYFSRDMNICYKDKNSGNKVSMHILNATNLIIPRAMMAILENFQQADGSVIVPKILRPYLCGLGKIKNEKSRH